MISFRISYPATKAGKAEWNKRFSLNAYWAGKHWAARDKDATEWHDRVHAALMWAQVPKKPTTKPVEICFRWDDGLDIDNHAAVAKMVVDALKGWVITDDNRRHFVRVVHEFWDAGEIGVYIREVS